MNKLIVLSAVVSLFSVAVASDDNVPKKVGPTFDDLSIVKPYVRLCDGDGCDAFTPILQRSDRYRDYDAQRKWGAALGGLSGALIGNEVADLPGAAVGALLGTVGGYNYTDRKQWEEDAKEYRTAWERGDDTYYNPAHRFPLEAHWMHAGPAVDLPDDKKE